MHDGVEAADLLDREAFDLVLLDIMLPAQMVILCLNAVLRYRYNS